MSRGGSIALARLGLCLDLLCRDLDARYAPWGMQAAQALFFLRSHVARPLERVEIGGVVDLPEMMVDLRTLEICLGRLPGRAGDLHRALDTLESSFQRLCQHWTRPAASGEVAEA